MEKFKFVFLCFFVTFVFFDRKYSDSMNIVRNDRVCYAFCREILYMQNEYRRSKFYYLENLSEKSVLNLRDYTLPNYKDLVILHQLSKPK